MQTQAERARALLLASGLTRFLWEEAMKHTTWLQNRTPARALDSKTPYEMQNKKKPYLGGIQEFGAATYVKDLKARKLDSRAQVGHFVGYDSESKGYRIYWPGKRLVTVEQNVVFNQTNIHTPDKHAIIPGDSLAEEERNKIIQPPSNNAENSVKTADMPESGIKPDTQTISNPQTEDETVPNLQEPQTTSSVPFPPISQPDSESKDNNDELHKYGHGKHVAPKPQGIYKKMHGGLVARIAYAESLDDKDSPSVEFPDDHKNMSIDLPPDFALVGGPNSEPRMLDEALQGPNAKEWQEALDYKISQLEKHGTWAIEDLPKGYTAISCGEVLRIKRGPSGKIQSYCVYIVAGGHRQVEGINYTETFSSAAKMPTVRAVLANAAKQDWEIEHVDVKSAYLNAPLKETVYIKPPQGVLKPGQEGKVARLLKGLYRLKQAGRGWYMEMSGVLMKELGFKCSAADHSVFYRHNANKHTIIAVTTDDVAVALKHKTDAERFKVQIQKFWKITDNGPISWFLGFEIKHDRKARTISIDQQAYIKSMVDKFRLTNAKPVSTPMDPDLQFSVDQCPFTHNQTAQMQGVPQQSNWEYSVASHHFETGHSLCCGSAVTIYPKSGTYPLVSCETGHSISTNNKNSMAYLWREVQDIAGRLLRCGLG
jgi:hypothetical protein